MTQDPADAPVPGAESEAIPAAQPVPAAFNGHGTLTPAQQTAQGVTAITEMLPRIAQAFGGLFGQLPQAIGQAARVPQHVCAQCLIARLGWEAAHMTELKEAIATAREAHGLPEGAAFPPGFDPSPFLPAHLRPGTGTAGMPPVQPAITTVNGTEVCAGHIPGQPGGRQLLIAHGSLNSSLLSQFAA